MPNTGAFVGAFITAGSGGLDNPSKIIYGPDGNLYVSSPLSNEVLRYHGQTGAFIDAFVTAGSGGLVEPSGIAFGPDGNLYVNSRLTEQVKRYHGSTGAFIDDFATIAGPGLDLGNDLVFGPDGNLYVAIDEFSGSNDRVLRYDGVTGAFLDVFGTGGFGFEDVVFGPDDNLYVVTPFDGNILRSNGTTPGTLSLFAPAINPGTLLFGLDGNLLYVGQGGVSSVNRLDVGTGALFDVFVTPGSGGLSNTQGMVFLTSVPEPASVAIWSLLSCALTVFGYYRVRRKK